VRAEHRPQLLVPALTDQVEVHLAERRQEAVRIVGRDHDAVGVRDLQLVVGHLRAVQHADPDAAVLVRQIRAFGARPGSDEYGDPLGHRPQHPHGHAVRAGVRAEHVVRVVVLAVDDSLQLFRGNLYGLHVHQPQATYGRLDD
jgi:hypothetical protein